MTDEPIDWRHRMMTAEAAGRVYGETCNVSNETMIGVASSMYESAMEQKAFLSGYGTAIRKRERK